MDVVEAVHPSNGAFGVPTNSNVWFVLDTGDFFYEIPLSGIAVLVDGTARGGSIATQGRLTYEGNGFPIHRKRLATFTPDPPFAPGDHVVLTLATYLGWTQGNVAFDVGTTIDLNAPTGGQILAVTSHDSTNGDDDDPGNAHYFGYSAEVAPALDDQGPALDLIELTGIAAVGQSVGETAHVLVGTRFENPGLNPNGGGRARLASQPIDLAGNVGELQETTFALPPIPRGNCFCHLGTASSPGPGAAIPIAIAFAGYWFLVRTRARASSRSGCR